MSEERGAAVRPAGAPMVPMAPMHPPHVSNGSGEGAGGAAMEKVRQAGGEVASQAMEKARQAGGEARTEARRRAADEVDRRSTMAGERVGSTAADLRDIAEELRKKDKEGPARLAEQAADRIDRLGAYLREADFDRLTADIGRIGRRQPMLLAVGAAAVGLVAARLIKAAGGDGNG